jgi:hypothetical protein
MTSKTDRRKVQPGARSVNLFAIFPISSKMLGKDKGKIHPRTGHEGLEWEYRKSSTLSLTSGLWMRWMVHATPRPLCPWERDPVSVLQYAGWAPGPVWTGAENLASVGILSPDRPARNEALYRLSYPGPHILGCLHISYGRFVQRYFLFITRKY